MLSSLLSSLLTVPRSGLTAFVAGVASASGVSVAEVGGIKITNGQRRRLLASVNIDYAITTTPAKAKAARAATEGGGFAAALATATVAAAKAVGDTIVFATPTVAKPTVTTKVEYKTVVKKSQAAALAAAVDPAALATSMVAELKKADIQLTAADMTVTKATTVDVEAPAIAGSADSGLKSAADDDATPLYAVGAVAFAAVVGAVAFTSQSGSKSADDDANEEDLELTNDA